MQIDQQPDITGAMKKLAEGQSQSREEAARVIWEYSYVRLVEMARAMLRSAPRGAQDEEDVALSSLKSFCIAAGDGRFPDLTSRDNLWRILYTITVRKAKAVKDHGRSGGNRDGAEGRPPIADFRRDPGISSGFPGQ
jgi:hypothetical protein